MYIIKQSTAIGAIAVGPFLDATDGVTPMTSLTITQPDIRLSKNGGTFAQKSASQTLSHMENGYYSLALSTTDTNTVGMLRVHVNESGALPVWMDLQVVEEAIYDALFGASATGLLPASVSSIGAGAITATSIASNAITDAKINAAAITAAKIATDAITADKIAANAITDSKIASGALTAAKFASGAFDAVWSVTTRLLTAGTNIVLAKGTGVTGFNDLDAAGVRTAVGLSSANLDTQLSTIDNEVGAIDTVVDSILEDTGTTLPATLATIDGEIGVIDGNVDDIIGDIAALNDLSAAQVNAEVDNALADYDPPTKAELDSAVAGLLVDLGEQTRTFTAQAGGASTITLDSGASSSDDFYNGALVVILDGTGDDVPVAERTRRITDYVGTTRVATVDAAWGTQPDNTTRAIIFGRE